jgi:hypothetical protein
MPLEYNDREERPPTEKERTMTQATKTATEQTPRTRNGISVDQLYGTLDVVKGQPELGKFTFRATNRWVPRRVRRRNAGLVALVAGIGISAGVLLAGDGDGTSRAHGGATLGAGDTPGVVQDSAAGGTFLADDPGISVSEALTTTSTQALFVHGALLVVGDEVRLYSALSRSALPVGDGPWMAVTGLDLDTIGLEASGNVRWSDGEIRLLGFLRDGVLVIDNVALAADGGAPEFSIED